MFCDKTISVQIAEHVADLAFEHLSPATLHATRRALLDALGVMLAATGIATDSLPYRTVALAQGSGPSRVLGMNSGAAPAAAALANGALAHALDFGDTFDPGPAHPNAALVPALLALADADPTIDGARFLTAMTAGSDLACRLSLAPARAYEEGGWYPPALVGLIAAAVACAKLLGLGADGIRHAMGLAMLQGSFPGEIKYDATSPLRGVREAFAARGAVGAALLAQAGARAFAAPLEGRAGFFAIYGGGAARDSLTADLGARFLGDEVSFKPWPCCRGTHAYIEAAIALRECCDWREIKTISAEIGPIQEMLIRPQPDKAAPQSAIEAKFSIPFTTAFGFIHGGVSLDSFDHVARNNTAVLELAQHVTEYRNPAWGREHAASGSLVVTLRSGERLNHQVPHAIGHPGNPLSDDALVDKFVACAARATLPMMIEPNARSVAAQVLGLNGRSSATSLLRPA
jgi:2-methylcitrate dehydratase PrpD